MTLNELDGLDKQMEYAILVTITFDIKTITGNWKKITTVTHNRIKVPKIIHRINKIFKIATIPCLEEIKSGRENLNIKTDSINDRITRHISAFKETAKWKWKLSITK